MKGQRDTGAYSSESELDDLPNSKITLPDDYADKKKGTQVAVRLHELGPRLKLQLHKVEEGLFRGNVVYHAHSNKSASEVRKQLDGLKNKRELKEKRKLIQEENIQKKKKAAEDKAGKWVKDDDASDGDDGKDAKKDKKEKRSDDFKSKSPKSFAKSGGGKPDKVVDFPKKKGRRPPPSVRFADENKEGGSGGPKRTPPANQFNKKSLPKGINSGSS